MNDLSQSTPSLKDSSQGVDRSRKHHSKLGLLAGLTLPVASVGLLLQSSEPPNQPEISLNEYPERKFGSPDPTRELRSLEQNNLGLAHFLDQIAASPGYAATYTNERRPYLSPPQSDRALSDIELEQLWEKEFKSLLSEEQVRSLVELPIRVRVVQFIDVALANLINRTYERKEKLSADSVGTLLIAAEAIGDASILVAKVEAAAFLPSIPRHVGINAVDFLGALYSYGISGDRPVRLDAEAFLVELAFSHFDRGIARRISFQAQEYLPFKAATAAAFSALNKTDSRERAGLLGRRS